MRRAMLIAGILLALTGCGKHSKEADPPLSSNGGHADERTVCGKIQLAPSVAGKFKPGTILFVFAKSGPGGGPPLAVKRVAVDRFPVDFCLSPADTMVPGLQFSGKVFVTARLSLSGNAGAGPGDLEGVTHDPVEVGRQDVVITIDTTR